MSDPVDDACGCIYRPEAGIGALPCASTHDGREENALAFAGVASPVLRRVGAAPMPQSGETAALGETVPSAKIRNP